MQHENGQADCASLDLLAKAQVLVKDADYLLCAVVVGDGSQKAAEALAAMGVVDKLYTADVDGLSQFEHLACADILTPFAKEKRPEVILLPSTVSAGLIASILGIRLSTGVIAHSINVALNQNGKLVGTVPAYGGQMLGDILCPNTTPQIATVRAGSMEFIHSDKQSEFISIPIPKRKENGIKMVGYLEEEQTGVPLADADIVVCGGAGLRNRETWESLLEVARLLGAAVACTRPPLDEGYGAIEKMMIGTSGCAVSPKIYMGFGVSGSTHHICGMKDSKLILNVNKDSKAPIVSASDYVFISDVQEVLPMLARELRARR